jgi:hypothetical protein
MKENGVLKMDETIASSILFLYLGSRVMRSKLEYKAVGLERKVFVDDGNTLMVLVAQFTTVSYWGRVGQWIGESFFFRIFLVIP